MHTLTGTPASAGVAIGPLVVIRPAPVIAGGRIQPGQEAAEIARLETAMTEAGAELDALAERVGAEHPAASARATTLSRRSAPPASNSPPSIAPSGTSSSRRARPTSWTWPGGSPTA